MANHAHSTPAAARPAGRKTTKPADAWPAHAIEAPPPETAPKFSDDVMRAVVPALKLHGEVYAARALRKFHPVLDTATARWLVETVIKPAAAAFARAVARGEAAQWRWEWHWQERLEVARRQTLKRVREARRAGTYDPATGLCRAAN
ncbi:MAG: hypothetical protein WCF85_11590 [Rhodospirillaceae bacterium]